MDGSGSENDSQNIESCQETAPPRKKSFRAWVPEWFVTLGSGFLFAGLLISLVSTGALAYLLITNRYTGPFAPLEPHASELIFVFIQFFAATVAQAVGIVLAYKRTRWGSVLLSCFIGSLGFITIPLMIPAFVLFMLGKHHFALGIPPSFKE